MIMNKKTTILSGILVMLGIVATVGVIASTTESGMIKKGVNTMPEGRSEYTMSDEELKQLEAELKAEEAVDTTTPTAPATEMMEEEEDLTEVTPA